MPGFLPSWVRARFTLHAHTRRPPSLLPEIAGNIAQNGHTSHPSTPPVVHDDAQLKLDKFFNLSLDLHCIVDFDNRFVRINPAFTRTLGYSEEELLASPFPTFIHPDDVAKTLAEMSSLESGEPTIHFENRYQCKDGRYKWLTWSAYPEPNEGLIYATARDSTATKEADHLLRKNSAELESIIKAMPSAMIFCNVERRIVKTNPEFERVFGYKHEEVEGRTTEMLYESTQSYKRQKHKRFHHRAKAQFEPYEQGYRRKDGRLFRGRTVGVPVKDSDGNVVGFLGLINDLTEKKKSKEALMRFAAAEARLTRHGRELKAKVTERTVELERVNADLRQALREQKSHARRLIDSQERFKLAIKASNNGIWDWRDVKEDNLWWSPRCYELLGYKYGEFEPSISQFKKLLHPDDVEKIFAKFATGYDGQMLFDLEYRLHTKDDGYRWFRGRGVVERDTFGNPIRVVGSISDIEDQRKAEQDRLRYAAELEEARDKAEAGTRAKSEFLANMSHEIRTPMNSVLGFTELLGEGELTDEQRQYLNIIRDNGGRLIELINDILDLSKIEAGHLELNRFPFSITKVVKNTLELFLPEAKKRGIRLNYEIDEMVPATMKGDEARIRQLLVNLVSNALKFTKEGSVKVVVTAQPVESDRVEVYIAVDDTGIGIEEEKRQVIFDSFTQVDASDTRLYGGTGLGLAICQRLAAMMEGEISVFSEEGKGSTFIVSLLLYKEHARKEEIVASSAAPPPAPSLPTTNITPLDILLTEDDLANQKLATLILSKMGHTIQTANNGEEAVKKLAETTFDVVLMDIQMPKMDGIEATKHIRMNLPINDQPYIIAVTARAMGGDRERFLAAGMNDYLSKPYTKTELTEVFSRYLKQSPEKTAPDS